jgi:hypothetical protein
MNGRNFSKLLGGIVLVIGFVIMGCDPGNGSGDKTYNVTIGTLTNDNGSTITANPTSGTEGTEITLTVNPSSGYKLKIGTLKYGSTAINETTKKFNLPASDVIVTAEFEIDTDFNPFIGIWNGTNEGTQNISGLTFEFSSDNKVYQKSSSDWLRGTYSFTDTQITINMTEESHDGGNTWSSHSESPIIQNYQLQGNKISFDSGARIISKQ